MLTAGARIGVYEIAALLGTGGMGEVYRARDTRLKRDVAIKVLPETFSHDADRLARFQREAELLATLNHPNIAAVYGLEDGPAEAGPHVRAIVMELVEGDTLAQLIASRHGAGFPLEDALPIAQQIADALEAAHERGVIHRDLKPANVKLTPDGKVKVLDFGLAKLLDTSPAASSLSMSPTLSVHATYAGVILGTAAYMSPEQARGKPVDRRTDIWAFGCVLFEMLTGRQTFASSGETVSDAVAAILRAEPEWAALPAATPAGLRRLLRRCLAKDPRERLHDVADARIEIQEVLQHPAGEAVAPGASTLQERASSRWRGPWAVTAALAIVAAALAVPATRYFREPPPERLVTRLEIVAPGNLDPLSLALSPDGRQLAFVATSDGGPRLWVRALDQTAARPLSGTDGASYPFWSPDGRAVGFFAEGKLKRVDLAGGALQTLADAPAGRGGTWSPDAIIVFAPTSGSGLMRVPATGGAAVAVTQLGTGQGSHRWPQFLPDGRRFLFFVGLGRADLHGVYVGSIDGGDPTRVLAGDMAAVYASPGWLLLVREGVLTAERFDPTNAVTSGDPVAIAQGLGVDANYFGPTFTASSTGVLTYRPGSSTQLRQLVWRDRTGRVLGTVGPPDETGLAGPALSPDGRRVGVTRAAQGNNDVWLADVSRGVLTRFTFDPSSDTGPVWSPDGTRIVFRSNRNGTFDLFEKPTNGAVEEQPLLATPEPKHVYDWSSDGRTLLFGMLSPKTGADVWALPFVGERKPFPVVQTSFAEETAQFSPDARWIAYTSNESGQFEIYVRPFPMQGGKWQVSNGGGTQPRWRADGKELFYVAPDGRMMAVPIAVGSGGQSLEVGSPVELFAVRFASGANIVGAGSLARAQYAVAADGRFLLNEAVEAAATTTPITIVLNWDAELRER